MAEPGVTIFDPAKSPPINNSPATPVVRQAPRVPSAASGTVQSNADVTPAMQRWADDQAVLDRMDPWRDTTNVVMRKDPQTGIVTAHPRGNGRQDAAPDAGQQPQTTPAGPATTDGTKLKVGDFELTSDDIRGLMERKSLEDGRRATMPKDPGDYSLDLPKDFQLPPGTSEWKWDLDNPTSAALIGQAKQFAFEHGLDGPAFSKMLGLYVSNQIAEETRFNDLKKAEIAKLGANISARVDAVGTWLESQLGSDLARALRTSMHTAKSVQAYERLMHNHISQGVGGSPGAARDGGYADRGPPRLSEAEYAKLSFTEKINYARQFDQSQFNGH